MSDADRIAQLEAENKAMREALEIITRHPIENEIAGRAAFGIQAWPSCQAIARAALSTTASKGGADDENV